MHPTSDIAYSLTVMNIGSEIIWISVKCGLIKLKTIKILSLTEQSPPRTSSGTANASKWFQTLRRCLIFSESHKFRSTRTLTNHQVVFVSQYVHDVIGRCGQTVHAMDVLLTHGMGEQAAPNSSPAWCGFTRDRHRTEDFVHRGVRLRLYTPLMIRLLPNCSRPCSETWHNNQKHVLHRFLPDVNSHHYTVSAVSLLPRCIECKAIVARKVSVRLSVCLSNVWTVTKRKKILSRFFYHTKDHLA